MNSVNCFSEENVPTVPWSNTQTVHVLSRTSEALDGNVNCLLRKSALRFSSNNCMTIDAIHVPSGSFSTLYLEGRRSRKILLQVCTISQLRLPRSLQTLHSIHKSLWQFHMGHCLNTLSWSSPLWQPMTSWLSYDVLTTARPQVLTWSLPPSTRHLENKYHNHSHCSSRPLSPLVSSPNVTNLRMYIPFTREVTSPLLPTTGRYHCCPRWLSLWRQWHMNNSWITSTLLRLRHHYSHWSNLRTASTTPVKAYWRV